MTKTIPYGKQNINQEDIDAVIQTLQADFLTQGPKIAEFEEKFAHYIGAKYAIALSNGTAALHLCALALGVNENSNVITTPITFVASANCVRYCGGNVYLADINPDTFTLDIKKVEDLILSKPKGFFKGIIPVDFAGYPVDLEGFRELALKHNLWIIQDSCHSPGGFFIDKNNNKQNCGNGHFADMAIFSFHPVKHIACGEGGMITTNNKELYDKLLFLRTHGITKNPDLLEKNEGGWYYEMQELGFNYRLTDFQAALGITQLNRADIGMNRRKEIASIYDNAFAETPAVIVAPKHEGHAYHLYVIQTSRRKELYDYLKEHHIYCQVHYIPIHLQPYYRDLGFKKGDFPASEKYYEQCLSLPMFPTLTNEEQSFVIQKIKEFFN